MEPLACVLRGLDETALRPGDTVAVIGLGPIGLMFVRLAKAYGARVIAIGRRKTQLDRAAAMGADELLISGDPQRPCRAVRDLTGGRGADVAIEAVGNPEVWETGGRIAAPRRHRQLLRRLPQRQPHQPGHSACCIIRRSPARPASITRPRTSARRSISSAAA